MSILLDWPLSDKWIFLTSDRYISVIIWLSNDQHIDQYINQGTLYENMILHRYDGPMKQCWPTSILVDILSNKSIIVSTDILSKVPVKYWWGLGVPPTISAHVYVGHYIDQVSIMTLVASQLSVHWVTTDALVYMSIDVPYIRYMIPIVLVDRDMNVLV